MQETKTKTPKSQEVLSAQLNAVELLPYLINRVTNQLNTAWMAELRKEGLTIQRWQILSILNFLDGSRIGMIAEISGISQAVLSRVIDQMERDKLVSRKPAPGDNRAVEVWITAKGRQLLESLMPAADAFVQELLGGFSKSERETMLHLLNRLTNAAEAMQRPDK